MIWWVLVIVLTLISYIPAIRHLAIQQPYLDKIIISNLTLNLLVLLLAVGAFSPLITRKLFPKAPKWAFLPVAIVLAVITIFTLKLLGVHTRV